MIKFLISVCILNFLSIFVGAQGDSKTVEDWKLFAPEYEEFTVESPIEFQDYKTPDDQNTQRYWNEINGTYLYIFSDSLKGALQNKTVLEFVNSQNQKGDDVTFQTFPSKSFKFVDDEGFSHRILVVKTNRRIYSFQVISPEKEGQIADRFFRTLSINGSLSKKQTHVAVEITENNIGLKTISRTPQDGAALGSGSGTARGSGQGSGTGNQEQKRTEPRPQTSAFKILAKPKAVYSDFARFYNISGRVRLRIILLASGKVGSITPVTKLPFGLTNNAIASARNIKFEPKMVNGIPVLVVVQFEYGFSIY